MLTLTLDELKNYLRIDGSEDDSFLTLLIDSAKEYLINAGVPESDSNLYKLAVMLYIAMQYENRDPSARMDGFNFALQSIILQLKDYPTDTTTTT
ncbi:phage gp6-like head-tail connector protein [Thermoactinomyces daqus]|uniref:Phage gp6-like head-tail connector protein n=1 Tax=Thermoactinomyces daqus TaxID=1329516 RepID=A0A7W1XBW7_9BACL|nr:head-tail connector protein [Thermoactinomyces daqus]MBA4543850.1 phage gp6-like head-tail connector protein [Thermoactinomyces daqus]